MAAFPKVIIIVRELKGAAYLPFNIRAYSSTQASGREYWLSVEPVGVVVILESYGHCS